MDTKEIDTIKNNCDQQAAQEVPNTNPKTGQ